MYASLLLGYFTGRAPRLSGCLLPPLLVLAGPVAHAQVPDWQTAEATTPPPLAAVVFYPNPAHIRTTVQVPAVPGATRAVLTLTNGQGQAVFTQPVSLPAAGATTDVPLLGLAPGLYRLVVQAGDQRVARTLTVE